MDPVAVLRIFPVVVTLGGEEFEIPALPAADWMEALAAGDDAVVPGLLSAGDEQAVVDMLLDGEVASSEMSDAANDAVAVAAGRPWWEARRLVGLAMAQPDRVLGALMLRGFDFEARSLGGLCAAVYALATEGMDKKERQKLDMQLKQVPAEVLAEDDDALSDAFMAAMAESQRGPS